MNDLDLRISGNSCCIDCRCSRWNVANYEFTVETWLTKDQLSDLRDSIVPGAVGELFKILGEPRYFDGTWQADNTITFTPTGSVGDLRFKVKEKTGFVKNITTRVISPDWIECKLSCFVSGSGDL